MIGKNWGIERAADASVGAGADATMAMDMMPWVVICFRWIMMIDRADDVGYDLDESHTP